MSSRRRSRSRDRKTALSKLRMDDRTPPPRITDPSLPAGRRREIDNVMKKARAQNSPTSSAIWEKKLLEVEAKDSNRWRHSGYKSLYLDGSSRSRSRSRSFSSSARRGGGNVSPSPPRRAAARSPRARSPRSPPPRGARSPRSPPPRGQRSPRSPPSSRRLSPPAGYRGGGRPRTPPSPKKRCVRRSASASSVSSCSDDSCSVCSPKTRRRSRSRTFSPPPRPSASSVVRKPPPPKPGVSSRPRPPSPSPSPPPRRLPRPTTPPVAKRMPRPMSSSDRPTDPRTRPPPPRPMPKPAPPKVGDKNPGKAALMARIKKEGAAARKKRPGSPGAESSGSEDSGISAAVPIVATTAMTLSERFGKIAQWSADRERRDIENMRITKTGSNMKVMVEEDEFLYGTPPRRYSLSPVPQGHYPDELLAAGPATRSAAWDDVRVRYQYYKDLGYLRDLSLEDYVKWEEWWYKYQDWLANERSYEHWLTTHNNSGGRRRKKRIPASQRLGT